MRALVLSKACVCGHDHETHRGESVEMCLDCMCAEYISRCQNCGEEATTASINSTFAVCSRRCALQLEYVLSRSRETAA